MKKMIVLMLAMVFLSLNGTAFAAEPFKSAKVKTHTGYWWFNLPDDGWNWPLYILQLSNVNPNHSPVTINLTLKDWKFSILETYVYILNPKDDLNITLNDLWPNYFDYDTGSAEIINYIIEVKVTEPKIGEGFYVWPEIDACGNPSISDPNGLGTDCYARYFGIIFLKLPPVTLNK